MFSEYRGIPWEARLLIYLSFIPNVAIGFIYTDLSYFLSDVQHLGPASAGVTIGVMGATVVAASIPMGLVADRYGRRKMLIIGNVCASLSLIGFSLTTYVPAVLLVAVMEGVGEAAYAVSVGALLAEKAGDGKRTVAFSLLAFLGWVAGAVGSFSISSVIALQAVGLDAQASHAILYSAVALLTLSITPFIYKVKESGPAGGEARRKGILPRKSGRFLLKFSVYSVAIAVGAGLFVPLMTLWFGRMYMVSDTVSGPALGLTNILTAGVVFMSPKLARKLGIVKAVVTTQAASTVFMVLIPSATIFPIAAGLYAVRVFLMNLSNPLTQSLVMGLVSPDERGMASGITAATWRLPNSLSAGVGGVLISAGMLALPFYVATVLYAFGIAVFWLIFRGVTLPEDAGPSPSDST